MLIFYPRLPNGNVFWSCDNCDNTAQVSFAETTAIALYFMFNNKINPQCNDDWYNKGLYLQRIPKENRNGYQRKIDDKN